LIRPTLKVDQIWAQEASDRLAAYRRGELQGKDLAEIVANYQSCGSGFFSLQS
jgi:hypothetical protein